MIRINWALHFHTLACVWRYTSLVPYVSCFFALMKMSFLLLRFISVYPVQNTICIEYLCIHGPSTRIRFIRTSCFPSYKVVANEGTCLAYTAKHVICERIISAFSFYFNIAIIVWHWWYMCKYFLNLRRPPLALQSSFNALSISLHHPKVIKPFSCISTISQMLIKSDGCLSTISEREGQNLEFLAPFCVRYGYSSKYCVRMCRDLSFILCMQGTYPMLWKRNKCSMHLKVLFAESWNFPCCERRVLRHAWTPSRALHCWLRDFLDATYLAEI